MLKQVLYVLSLSQMFMAAILILVGSAGPALSHSSELEVLEITKVYDGDTFKVNLNCTVDLFCKNIPIRPTNYDAFELRDPVNKRQARAAREKLKSLLANAQRVELRNVRRGKYFRLVADVYVDDRRLSDIMLSTGLVKPYGK